MLTKNQAPIITQSSQIKSPSVKPPKQSLDPTRKKQREASKAKESEVEEEISECSFDDHNMNYCGVCSKPGTLICCDTCPGAYHTECLGFERVTLSFRRCRHQEGSGDVISVR